MSNYYFLATLLPELEIGSLPEIDYREFSSLIAINLHTTDLEKVRTIKLYDDIQNIRSLWREEPINVRGNLDENELEDALLTQTILPDYVFDFMDRFERVEDRLKYFSSLIASYFNQELSRSKSFVYNYLYFERNMRLVLIALRTKKLDRDLFFELQFEDPDDPFIAQILVQKDTNDYLPPEGYEEIKEIFNIYSEHPLELQKALNSYRFQKVEELLGVDLFSINHLLTYLIKLTIVEQWLALDSQKGSKILENIIKETS